MSAPQRSEEWLIERIGMVTGSRFQDVIAMDKSGKRFLQSRETAITEISLELLTGRPGASWSSKATRWGNEYEPMAREAYEVKTGEICSEVGFIVHPVFLQVGCSPDGLIGNHRGWEAKCPFTPAVHLKTLLNGMPPEHMAQVQGGMWVTGRAEWDFVSFHPEFPENMQLYIETIPRDDAYIENMQNHVLSAVAEINCNVRDLLNKYRVSQ